MRIHSALPWLLVSAIATVAALGCAGASEDEPSSKKKHHTTDTGTGGAGPGGSSCDAYATLASYCLGCHGEPPTGGAPIALVTRDELAAISPAGGTYAERSVIRMKDAAAPMPPLPQAAVPADRVAAFEAWVVAGMPDDCGGGTGGAAPSPYDTPEVCTCAGMPMGSCTWLGGDHESPDMHPGRACVDCHSKKFNAPKLWVGGTVYPTAHEPDDCFGFDGLLEDTIVEITDATMATFTMPVRKSGNFYWTKSKGLITMPIKARVIRGTQVRAMAAAVDNGDCNTCHTLTGAGTPPAPGRIMAP